MILCNVCSACALVRWLKLELPLTFRSFQARALSNCAPDTPSKSAAFIKLSTVSAVILTRASSVAGSPCWVFSLCGEAEGNELKGTGLAVHADVPFDDRRRGDASSQPSGTAKSPEMSANWISPKWIKAANTSQKDVCVSLDTNTLSAAFSSSNLAPSRRCSGESSSHGFASSQYRSLYFTELSSKRSTFVSSSRPANIS
mmetsp:Transcript_122795/g.352685  ORF Transcript_122795/g.352685 Transcript_122795/m.352685 type:complete len:200 (+) Transcript_122795:3064-3663(+)